MNNQLTNDEHDHSHSQEQDQSQGQSQDQGPERVQDPESPSNEIDHRTRRAHRERMDVSLAQKGGIYEVWSASGNTYEVDIGTGACSCPDWQRREPDGGCKHRRRVDMEIKAGRVPRPDGRLPQPTPASMSASTDPPAVATDGGPLANTDDTRFATCMDRIAERAQTLEAEIDHHRTELVDLECALAVIGNYLPDSPDHTVTAPSKDADANNANPSQKTSSAD